eukprot:scaffold99711_cov44-Attheya_sp.AAC.1
MLEVGDGGRDNQTLNQCLRDIVVGPSFSLCSFEVKDHCFLDSTGSVGSWFREPKPGPIVWSSSGVPNK